MWLPLWAYCEILKDMSQVYKKETGVMIVLSYVPAVV